MGRFRYVIADVFTDTPLQGNQVAVFTDARELPEDKLQQVAREMNLSETVFVYKPEGEGHARIRIFTPTREMPFAGHPTLGTAFVLSGPLQLEVIKLETGRGLVPVRLDRDESGRIVFGRMEQPLPTVEPYPDANELFDMLGVEGSELPVEVYDNGVNHVYVCLGSEDEVAALRPDMAALADRAGVVCVNCFAGEGPRWKTRMFAPGAASRRTRRPVPRPGRSRSISPATAGSRSATRSRSPRASRWAARRPSSRGSRDRRTTFSASRSAAAPSPSAAASSASERSRSGRTRGRSSAARRRSGTRASTTPAAPHAAS